MAQAKKVDTNGGLDMLVKFPGKFVCQFVCHQIVAQLLDRNIVKYIIVRFSPILILSLYCTVWLCYIYEHYLSGGDITFELFSLNPSFDFYMVLDQVF